MLGLLPSASAQTRPAYDAYDVFLVAGQSNAEGRATLTTALPPALGTAYALRPEVLGDHLGPRAFGRLSDPLNQTLTGSAWPVFAQRYAEVHGRGVVLVVAAIGATAQHAAADLGRGHWDTRTPGPGASGGAYLWPRALGLLDAAMDSARARLPDATVRLGGILWSQGEADVGAVRHGILTPQDYALAFQASLDYAQGELEARDTLMPSRDPAVFVIRTGRSGGGDRWWWQLIRDAQDAVLLDGHARLVCDDAVAFPDTEGWMEDLVHYGQPGLDHIGAHAAEVIPAGYPVGSAELPATDADEPSAYPNPVAPRATVWGLRPLADIVDVLGRRVGRVGPEGAFRADLAPGVYAVDGVLLTVR